MNKHVAVFSRPDLVHIPLKNKARIAEFLKPGDLLVNYSTGHQYPMDNAIINLNKVTLPLTRYHINLPEPARCVHVQLALGGAHIAEAESDPVWEEIHTINFKTHEAFDESPNQKYLVFRPKNAELGKSAAAQAEKFTHPYRHNVPPGSAFSKTLGAIAFFQPIRMTQQARERYLKAAIYGSVLKPQEQVPSAKGGYRNFFCSYFLLWCWQSAQGQTILTKLGIEIDRNQLSTEGRLDPKKVSALAKTLAQQPAINNELRASIFPVNQRAASPLDVVNIALNKGHFDLVATLDGPRV